METTWNKFTLLARSSTKQTVSENETHLLEGVQDAHLDLLLDGLDLSDFFGIRHD